VILTNAQTNALGVLAQPGGGHFVAGLIAFASYPFFLYCNFSGYIDMVIGIARLLGIELPENFNRPFSSESFIEFWSRWHITLSEWFRNYVYNPLLMGLMRKYPAENLEAVWAVLAFFFTFFLVGVWHGQTPSFLFYGVLQGFGVSANKLYQIVMAKRLGRKRFKALSSQPIYVTFARGLTFTWFTFTLLWFWSNFEQIGKFFGSLGVWRVVEVWFTIWVGASILLAAWEWVRKAFLSIQWQGVSVLESRYWRTAWDTGLVLVASAVVLLSNQPAPELVYRAF
jgi:D-alanyl-lipoteichoic acid acyltransferase DltB (MBOAT superfamily)